MADIQIAVKDWQYSVDGWRSCGDCRFWNEDGQLREYKTWYKNKPINLKLLYYKLIGFTPLYIHTNKDDDMTDSNWS